MSVATRRSRKDVTVAEWQAGRSGVQVSFTAPEPCRGRSWGHPGRVRQRCRGARPGPAPDGRGGGADRPCPPGRRDSRSGAGLRRPPQALADLCREDLPLTRSRRPTAYTGQRLTRQPGPRRRVRPEARCPSERGGAGRARPGGEGPQRLRSRACRSSRGSCRSPAGPRLT